MSTRSHSSWTMTLTVASAMVFTGLAISAQDGAASKRKPQAAAGTEKSPKPPETATETEPRPKKTPRQHFMEGKLVLSQEILRGVVLQEFERIEKNAVAMNVLTLAEEWGFSNSGQYVRLSEDLRRITKELAKAGHEKNIHAATVAYQRMTLNCVECHQALAEGFKSE